MNWVLDADIQGFFDAMAHSWTIRFLEHRIADKRILRLIVPRCSRPVRHRPASETLHELDTEVAIRRRQFDPQLRTVAGAHEMARSAKALNRSAIGFAGGVICGRGHQHRARGAGWAPCLEDRGVFNLIQDRSYP